MSEIQVTDGWTGSIDWQLRRVPAEASTSTEGPLDLTGKIVELILRDRDRKRILVGTTTSTSGELVITNSTGGMVQYNPSSPKDLAAARQPYSGRFKVTDAAAKVVYAPSGPPDIWTVFDA